MRKKLLATCLAIIANNGNYPLDDEEQAALNLPTKHKWGVTWWATEEEKRQAAVEWLTANLQLKT